MVLVKEVFVILKVKIGEKILEDKVHVEKCFYIYVYVAYKYGYFCQINFNLNVDDIDEDNNFKDITEVEIHDSNLVNEGNINSNIEKSEIKIEENII